MEAGYYMLHPRIPSVTGGQHEDRWLQSAATPWAHQRCVHPAFDSFLSIGTSGPGFLASTAGWTVRDVDSASRAPGLH